MKSKGTGRTGRGFTGLVAVAAIALAGLALGACQAPGSVLKGTVTTAEGTHVAGVPVAVYSNTAESVVAQTTTDADGDYSFLPDVLPDGTYRILFATSDWWDGGSSWATATPVAVSAAAPAVIDPTLAIETGSITGTVTDGTQPASNVLVVAFDPTTGNAMGIASTAVDGTFTFDRFEVRAYTVGFFDGSHMLRSSIYGSASQDPTSGTPVTPIGGAIDLGTIAMVASTAPAAPTGASATPGDGQATVTWTAPTDDGGAPITGYTVTAPTGQSCATTGALSCVVTGLVNKKAVTFRVTAENLLGTSTPSVASAGITPVPADFCSRDHSYANFRNAQFTNADFTGCNFSGANLTGAVLSGANLTDADLSATRTVTMGYGPSVGSLPAANLTDAVLTNANLSGADLSGEPAISVGSVSPQQFPAIPGTDLTGADLTGAMLTGLISAGITSTPAALPPDWQLVDGFLVGPGADLTDAVLTGFDITGLDLTGATLTGVISGNVTGSPEALPTDWILVDGFLVGPGANLKYADLTSAALANANLTDADLFGADLTGVDFTGANLTGARLRIVHLDDATLTDATLTGVRSSSVMGTPAALPDRWQLLSGYLVGPGANLAGFSLGGVDLTDVELSGANLTGTTLRSAILAGADLSDADLTDAKLSIADLSGADLTGATMTGVASGYIEGTPTALPTGWHLINGYLVGPGANLAGAGFSGGGLANADLSGFDLSDAILTNAVLTGVNLSGTNLAGATLTGVTSGGITGTPAALPTGWTLVGGVLVPPS